MEAFSGQTPPEEKDSLTSVKVAVNIRPLIPSERLQGCTDCIAVVPGEPQVQIASHAFTFDHVYGSSGTPAHVLYEDCVAPLVDALFSGYNATVLAYGQTGSGKTYTMGTGHNEDGNHRGITPKVMDAIFEKIDANKDSTEFLVRVSFIEIFKEEVFDLLDSHVSASMRNDAVVGGKSSVYVRAPIQIRETAHGGITLSGVTEAEVGSKEEMASFLAQGSLCRATGCTNMNRESSRSHAIFTITFEQKKIMNGASNVLGDENCDDFLSAKLHLVDLAGSERAKRTGADGLRFKEGVHINRGLLALGNVISALGDEKKRKEGGHVPYRDSKLTRLLQDSLGGNSKTVMIACISPAETNAEETLNTLKYANRARNIQNKAIVNRNPVVAEMQRMRSQLEQLQTELLFARAEGAPFEELQVLRHRISVLESNNIELRQELEHTRINCERLTQSAVGSEVEKDRLLMKIESVRNGKSWVDIDDEIQPADVDLLKNYVTKIQQQEAEILRLKNSCHLKKDSVVDCLDLDDHESSFCDGRPIASSGETEVEEKVLAHSLLQDTLGKELRELDKCLEQKEAEMKLYSSSDTLVLKQHYEKKLSELEKEKKLLQKEMEHLTAELMNISSKSDESAKKLKAEYLQKLNTLEAQVAELKKKHDAQSQLLRQKQKSDEAARRLQEEIQRIKSQKVQLQHKMKQESEQFRAWKSSREKEVLQLKKEGRRNTFEMHKLLALNQRQKMVLQRKTEEAATATRRLKELLEARKAPPRDAVAGGNGNNAAGYQTHERALRQAIEHELEVMVRVHEVRSEYDRQIQERARMAEEIAKLKDESDMLKQNPAGNCTPTMSSGARSSKIFLLENMLSTSSSTLVSMASQLSEAEERERLFSGRGRWNQVRSIVDAKNLLNHLFNLASSSRCCLLDKERESREKENENEELRAKIGKLSSLLRQMEAQHKMQEVQQVDKKEGVQSYSGEELPYDLRRKIRSSICFNYGPDLFDEMDISDSERSDDPCDDDYQQSDACDDDNQQSDASDDAHQRNIKRRHRKKGHKRVAIPVPITEEGGCSSQEASLESSEEATNSNILVSSLSVCCTCSSSSGCKTLKCECRKSGGLCGGSCGCRPRRCANRQTCSDEEANALLAVEGAALLGSAMQDVSAEVNPEAGKQRKPLSDISNVMAASNASQATQRKKWKRSSIQLVPAPTPTVPDGVPEPQQPDEVLDQMAPAADEEITSIPLKLPRAMQPLPKTNSESILRERNADQEVEVPRSEKPPSRGPSRSPLGPAMGSNAEKENGHHL